MISVTNLNVGGFNIVCDLADNLIFIPNFDNITFLYFWKELDKL